MGHHMLMEYGEKKPSADITKGDENAPMMWVGTASVYFTALYRPDPLVKGQERRRLHPPMSPLRLQLRRPDYKTPRGVTIESTELTGPPGQPLVHPAHLFLGPRWRKILSEPYYAEFPRDYDQSLIMRAGPCGYCTFDWLINGLVKLLAFFHMITRDWGLAIICLVVLVRSLLHPITKRSQVLDDAHGQARPGDRAPQGQVRRGQGRAESPDDAALQGPGRSACTSAACRCSSRCRSGSRCGAR
jgi:hypothetical protein